MADKIGVLGEATTTTAATTTVYTVPSSKAAKGRLFYEIQGAGDGTTDLTITVNGIDVMVHANITASNFLFSSPNAIKEGPLAYFLSAADTVTYTIAGTTALAMNMQFVGAEIDV